MKFCAWLKFALLTVTVSSIAACRKPDVVEPELESPASGTRAELTLDSVFLYARHVYVWHEALPDYRVFNPRKYHSAAASELLNLKKAVFDLTTYAVNPLTSKPYEYTALPGFSKYSFIEESDGYGRVAAANGQSDELSATGQLEAVRQGDIGYLRFTQFYALSSMTGLLDEAFELFAQPQGITSLIIDLRGNMGGYTETAEYIADLLALPSMNEKTMYTQQFNTEMQAGRAKILKHQVYKDENGRVVYVGGRPATYADIDFSIAANTIRFQKKGALTSLKKLCFIVNKNTASASELLINVMKPYVPVTLIGTKTYGKPVGSFGIVVDRYTLHVPSFLIYNAAGAGGYFSGFTPDIEPSDEQLGSNAADVLDKVGALTGDGPEGRIRMTRTVGASHLKAVDFLKDPIMLRKRFKIRH
ncbi:S41 family peptidase [Pedobacter deserti]|uniref:S41 family peptidase n=1 Tax=Pedobacter deserti TaxID=2817382 RepID=UPI00210A0304|nr:S41 family peptidase [Pedobacter sp. SYSU D00382]